MHFAYSIVVAKHVNSFEGFLHLFCDRKCTSHSKFPAMHIVFFSFTASGCYVVFIKEKLCSFSFKISLQRAQHVQFALVLITHRCFTLKLQAARRNTDKICYDERTIVLSTRISSLSALSSCLGTFKASGRLILIE